MVRKDRNNRRLVSETYPQREYLAQPSIKSPSSNSGRSSIDLGYNKESDHKTSRRRDRNNRVHISGTLARRQYPSPLSAKSPSPNRGRSSIGLGYNKGQNHDMPQGKDRNNIGSVCGTYPRRQIFFPPSSNRSHSLTGLNIIEDHITKCHEEVVLIIEYMYLEHILEGNYPSPPSTKLPYSTRDRSAIGLEYNTELHHKIPRSRNRNTRRSVCGTYIRRQYPSPHSVQSPSPYRIRSSIGPEY